jgi:hypothetical protein
VVSLVCGNLTICQVRPTLGQTQADGSGVKCRPGLCRRIFERLGNSQRRHPSFFRPKSRHARTIRHNSMTSIWTRRNVQTRRPLPLAGTRCHRKHQMSPNREGSMVPKCRTSSKKQQMPRTKKVQHFQISTRHPRSHTSTGTLKVQHFQIATRHAEH